MFFTDEVRQWLYPLGFISNLAFSARFFFQWISSELAQKSQVSKNFWVFSILGNVSLTLHALIQSQFPLCFMQLCCAILALRNLNLMQPKEKQFSFKTVLWTLLIANTLLILCFSFQADGEWFRVPTTPWFQPKPGSIGLSWHLLGIFGLTLFSLRFWLQWWEAEKSQTSTLNASFWWTSLIGGLLCSLYFLRFLDIVNFLGPAFGLIPYLRNLMLIYKKRSSLV